MTFNWVFLSNQIFESDLLVVSLCYPTSTVIVLTPFSVAMARSGVWM
jgi:hypothetical protein